MSKKCVLILLTRSYPYLLVWSFVHLKDIIMVRNGLIVVD